MSKPKSQLGLFCLAISWFNQTEMFSKKQIRQNRLWRHFKLFITEPIFDNESRKITNYNPELYKEAFLQYQTSGAKGLSEEQLEGIKPLIDAQKQKEITLNSLVMETFEWDSKGWGWTYPISDVLSRKELDRLTVLAILRIKRQLQNKSGEKTFVDRLEFYKRHPISKLWESEFNKKLTEFNLHFGI